MKKKDFAKKLLDAANKLRDKNEKFEVDEKLTLGRGEGNYRLEFRAVRKKQSLFKSIAKLAKTAVYYGIEGAIAEAATEAVARKMGVNLEPIHKEMTASELAAILERWAKTVPDGYIETIGNVLLLPKEDKWINAKINPNKEIHITIDFARLKESIEEGASAPLTQMSQTPKVSMPMSPPVNIPITPAAPISVPMGVDLSHLYVKGSLKNYESGFELAIRNPLTTVRILEPFIVKVDGKTFGDLEVVTSIGKVKNSEISSANPLLINQGEMILLRVPGEKLSPGTHKIDIVVNVEGPGRIMISNIDVVS